MPLSALAHLTIKPQGIKLQLMVLPTFAILGLVPSDFVFCVLLVWSLADSSARWLNVSRSPSRPRQRYLPVHYVAGFLGSLCWLFDIGTLEYSQLGLNWLQPTSLALMSGGWILTFSGRAALGPRWTPHIEHVPPEQRISSGAYAFLKHPIYTGETLFFLGLSAYLSNVILLALLFIGGTAYNFYRAFLENQPPAGHDARTKLTNNAT